MTHQTTRRFRRLGWLAVPAVLALGLAVPASAAFAGETPTPQPISSYGHHHHMQRHCELVLLTGSAVDQDHQGQDVGGGGYQSPSTLAPDHQQGGDRERKGEELVKVEQLAEVCERGEHLTVFDVTRAFAQETENQPPREPQPYDQPSPSVYVTPAG